MEYSKNGVFEDRATLAFLNRNLTVPGFTQSVRAGFLKIQTSNLTLMYRVGSVFSAGSLNVTSKSFSWVYGSDDPLNLLGTVRSLDEVQVETLNCTLNANQRVHGESLHCEWGLISRSGYSVVDDSKNYAVDDEDWWQDMNKDDEDLYFFGHGLDYKSALSDFTKVAGKIAMIPRYANGIMWSRWYNINGRDMINIVDDYESRDLPLDIFILDMDWHTKENWGAFSFDSNLFPIPQAPLSYLKDRGLHFGVNIHDDNGVQTFEKMYKDFAVFLGFNPQTHGPIEFDCINSSYMYGLQDIVLGDVYDQGINFWWTDWQQGGTEGGCAGDKQNPTMLTNKVRSTEHIRRNEPERGLILNRWGGLGNHRYQIGFSGDVGRVNWADLAYQPYFSYTSSNVGFGFWSHDLVGTYDDHELHTRWIQWGAFSGAFRTHDRGMAVGSCANNNPSTCAIVEVWNMPQRYFSANRAAMRMRAALIPYIYTATRQSFDTGISLLRPMYYEFPELTNAYVGDYSGKFSQYFFGDDMIVAPIVFPANANNMSSTNVWIPPGTWVETTTGRIHKGSSDGSTILKKSYDLSEIPVFVRGGAIIPTIPLHPRNTIGLAQKQYTELELNIYPGANSYTTKIYEDDGLTTAYTKGNYGYVIVSYQRNRNGILITISEDGSYPERPVARSYRIKLINGVPLTSAQINKQKIIYSRGGGVNTWSYHGDSFETIIESDMILVGQRIEISAETFSVSESLISGFKGLISHAQMSKAVLDETNATPGSTTGTKGGKLSLCSSLDQSLSYLANNENEFMKVFDDVPHAFEEAKKELLSIEPNSRNENVDAVTLARWEHAYALLLNGQK